MHQVTQGYVIRTARLDELEQMAQLRREMIADIDGEDYDQLYPGWRERFVAFFGAKIADGNGVLFVAESGGNVIGTAAVYTAHTHRTQIIGVPSAYICNVFVRPPYRRRGIARALTESAITWAKNYGCEVVRLRTSRMGRPVYEGLGFVRTDELEMRL